MVKVEQAHDGHFFIQAPTYPSSSTIRTWEVHPKGVDWLGKNRIAIGQEFDWDTFRDLKDFGYAVLGNKNPNRDAGVTKSGQSARPKRTSTEGFTVIYGSAPTKSNDRQTPRTTTPQTTQPAASQFKSAGTMQRSHTRLPK